MIKKLILPAAIAIMFVFQTSSVLAFPILKQPCSESSGAQSSSVCQPDSKTNPLFGKDSILDEVINLISIIVGIVAVFAIIVAGFMFITSGGDSARVGTARNAVLYVIIGIIIVAIAQVIEIFVIDNIGPHT